MGDETRNAAKAMEDGAIPRRGLMVRGRLAGAERQEPVQTRKYRECATACGRGERAEAGAVGHCDSGGIAHRAGGRDRDRREGAVYSTDLKKEDFKVYEDNKEQSITSFSSGSDAAVQNASNQRHYLILFFDTSSMEMADQMQARNAATKFIESNTNPDALMAVVNFGGSLQIRQNFTANAELLKAAVSGSSVPHIDSNAPSNDGGDHRHAGLDQQCGGRPRSAIHAALPSQPGQEPAWDFRTQDGYSFSAGFPLDAERMSELTATIDTCNKANVAIYSLDVRGLVANSPGGKPPEPANKFPRKAICSIRCGLTTLRMQANRGY